ncbi:uncharacterized protein TNCV_2527781 [Trichonephila clavipes]|nr:uncharacterized protein TNCV_2527781 [Trichonephila clavipes]
MDHVILNHGQVTWMTPELAPPLLTTTPGCPTRRVFSGTGLEPMTKPATIRYLHHSATVAALRIRREAITKDDPARSELPTYFAHSAQEHPSATMRQSAEFGRVFGFSPIAVVHFNGIEVNYGYRQYHYKWFIVGDKISVSILHKLKHISQHHDIHFQWIPSLAELYGNEMADKLAKEGCNLPNSPHPPLPRKNLVE